MTCDTGDHDAGVKKKPATFQTGDREAKAEEVYDAYDKFKITRVRNKKGEVRVRVGTVYIALIVFYSPDLTSSRHTFESRSVSNRMPTYISPLYHRFPKKFELPDGTREGLFFVLEEIKAAYARARARCSKDVLWKRMNLPKFRNGHFPMIGYLGNNDEEFRAGDWYEKYFCAIPGRRFKTMRNLITELQFNDRRDDDVDETFYWEWWSKWVLEIFTLTEASLLVAR